MRFLGNGSGGPSHRRRVAANALAAGGVCLLLVMGPVHGEDKPPNLPPKFVAKLSAFYQKVAAAQRKDLDASMARRIADIAKVTGLSPEGVKSLQAAAAQAEDASQADMQAKCVEVTIKQYAQIGGADLSGYDSPEVVAMVATSDLAASVGAHYRAADDQPVWTDALARTLTPDQAAAWAQSDAGKKASAVKEIEAFLDTQTAQYREMLNAPIAARGSSIVACLGLPKERADQMENLEKKAVDASLSAWRQDAIKSLLGDDEVTRKRMLQSRGMYFALNSDDSPEKQAVWKDGLAKLLNDDERTRLQVTADAQHARRVHALGQLLVAVLDEGIAFTASQRPLLEPMAERLVQPVTEFFPDAGQVAYYQLSFQTFYQAAAAAKPEEVRPLLDDAQWQDWQEVSHRQSPPQRRLRVSDARKVAARPAGPDATAQEEPEDMEQALSDFLRARASERYKEAVAALLIEVEDAKRVAGLAEPNVARLQTAARGAAEAIAAASVATFEPNYRSLAQGATLDTIVQRLGNAPMYQNMGQESKPQPIWEKATQAELTPAQQAAWQKERDARSQYKNAAIAQFLLSEFDRKFWLTPEQWSQLAPLVTQALNEYASDIAQMFVNYNVSPWYLMSYSMFLPLLAIPENDFKAVLTKQQWDEWTGSTEYSNSSNYFQNIKINHEARNGTRVNGTTKRK